MTTPPAEAKLAHHHISIDCVVLGFDGSQVKVLLLRRQGQDPQGGAYSDMKLPGSLIYEDEDLDEAARRVLRQQAGVRDMALKQFKTFGSKDRTRNLRDVLWLERAQQARVERIITVAYYALVKLDPTVMRAAAAKPGTEWVALADVGPLAFDHNQIILDAMQAVKTEMEYNRSMLFDLLPRKFTASQLRLLCEILSGRQLDVRNFHKKIIQMPYIVALEEKQKGVAHRAARYFKFDRKAYNAIK